MFGCSPDKLQYFRPDPDFEPLPKYGHLSEKTPELVAVEDAIRDAYRPFYALPDIPAFRRAAGDPEAAMPAGGPDRHREVRTELARFPARDGHPVELKIYKSPDVAPDATLMYRMHGGAFCVGGHEVDGAENVYAATNPDIVVVSVDYRLAPEHPFPKPVEDCYDGLLWCKSNAASLGVNPEKIIVAGGSAGGNLAAVMAIMARDDGVSGIVAQVLHFPSLCHPKFYPYDKYELGSHVQNASNCVLSAEAFGSLMDAYVPDVQPDHRHSPLLASSLAGLPPALLQFAGVDMFRDESFAYADALRAAGVEAEVYCYGGVPHCFPSTIITHPLTPVFYERYNAFLRKHATSSRRRG
ncbi:putative AB hydrolase superfamily protein [Rosellinia necatrix]|uniref:Putative AB hydrolase superfamily protein n=1 Tax=Rosellinia necatrix TaxID=77044 RepID=A0A1W2TV57_ROSNE|nr:putative AB hydrolase superfamily protein [Rosellinia necatrix]